jgi:hypothetical protein
LSDVNMSKLLNQAIAVQFSQYNFCTPAEVVSYDFRQQRAAIRPTIAKRFVDGVTIPPPIIENVPVVFPRAGGASLTMPVNIGDTVLALFADRNIENWLNGGGIQEPKARGMHSLNDAIAIAGLIPFVAGSLAENNEDVLLTYQNAKVRLKQSGEVQVQSNVQVLIDAPTIFATGNMTIAGTFTAEGNGGTGTSTINGTLNATTDVTSGGISLRAHVHGGVQAGGANTGVPV